MYDIFRESRSFELSYSWFVEWSGEAKVESECDFRDILYMKSFILLSNLVQHAVLAC